MMSNSSHYRPYLAWVIEPENKHRFRYLSEGGSHGGLNGKAGKKTFPTLQLRNYHGKKKILVRVRLYTEDEKEHVLEFKGKKFEGSKRFLEEPLQEDNTVIFKDIKILSKKKDEIEEILMERRLSNLKDGMSSVVRAQFEKRYRKDVKERAKSILNSVRLHFEAFEESKPDAPLCSLFSDAICNQKAASKGDLRISRLSHYSGSWKGNDEVILLCEKVQKDNIKIKFYEVNQNGAVIWEDYGTFSPVDVHYQVAIYFKTPPYRSNIEKKVNICLERNEETSEPREFTYKPDGDESSSKKRKLEPYHFNSELSSENVDSSESVSSMSVSSPESAPSANSMPFSLPLNDSDEMLFTEDQIPAFLNFLDDNLHVEDLPLLFENLPDSHIFDDGSDGIPMFYGEDVIDGSIAPRDTNRIMNQSLNLVDIDSGLTNGSIAPRDTDRIINHSVNSDGIRMEDIIDGSIAPRDTDRILNQSLNLVDIHSGFIDGSIAPRDTDRIVNHSLNVMNINSGLKNLTLKDRNERKSVGFVSNCSKRPLSNLQCKQILRLLLKTDSCGNSLLHIAVLLNRNIEPILKVTQAAKRINLLINGKNKKNQTALHLAIEKNRREAVRILLKYGSNPNLKDRLGNNCYHIAAKNNFPDALEEINRFSTFPHEIEDFNDEGLTPVHIAIVERNPHLFHFLKIHISDVNIKEKKAGRSLLHYVVDFQPALLLEILEMDGIDVNVQDFEGNTPLHLACATENVEAVQNLLYFGADPFIKNFKDSLNSLELENSEDSLTVGQLPSDLTADIGQLPTDLTADIEILQLLKIAEENEKSAIFANSGGFEGLESLCPVSEKLSQFLDKDMQWKKLVPYYLESDMEDSLMLSPSPSKALLHYIKKNGQDNYLEGLKAVLEIADLKEAVSIINE